MKLIGLIGKARSGKDTVASHLYRFHDFESIAFATPMKSMLETAFPSVNFHSGDREAIIPWLGKSPRQLLQTLGTEWGRECVHPDLWMLLAERRIQACREVGDKGLVITDVRFHNEADMILRNGGQLWHIHRDSAKAVNAHASETCDWSGYPRKIIDNNGTHVELYAKVDELANELLLGNTRIAS